MKKVSLLSALFLTTAFALTAGCASTPAADDTGATDSAFSNAVQGKTKVLLLPWTYAKDGSADTGPQDTNAFNGSATTLASFYNRAYYKSAGYTGTSNPNITIKKIGTKPEDLIAVLQDLKAAGKKFDRVVTLSHGGVDGPVFSEESGDQDTDQGFQIGWDFPNDRLCSSAAQAEADACSNYQWYNGVRTGRTKASASQGPSLEAANLQALADIGSLIHDITNDGAFVWLGACNPGHATTNIDRSVNFVQLMACISGRETFGTKSKTTAVDMAKDVQALETTLVTQSKVATATADSVNATKMTCASGGSPATPKVSGSDSASVDPGTDPNATDGVQVAGGDGTTQDG